MRCDDSEKERQEQSSLLCYASRNENKLDDKSHVSQHASSSHQLPQTSLQAARTKNLAPVPAPHQANLQASLHSHQLSSQAPPHPCEHTSAVIMAQPLTHSPGSPGECRTVPRGRQPSDQANQLEHRSTWSGSYSTALTIATQPKSRHSFYCPMEGRRLSWPGGWLHTEIVYLHADSCHSGTNTAQSRDQHVITTLWHIFFTVCCCLVAARASGLQSFTPTAFWGTSSNLD